MARVWIFISCIFIVTPVWGYANYALLFIIPWAFIQLFLVPLCLWILRDTARMYPATIAVPKILPFTAIHIVLDVGASYLFFSIMQGRTEHNDLYYWYFLIMPSVVLLAFVGFCKTTMRVRLLSILILLACLVLLVLFFGAFYWVRRH